MRKDWLPGETTVVVKRRMKRVRAQPSNGINDVFVTHCVRTVTVHLFSAVYNTSIVTRVENVNATLLPRRRRRH
jgi:hypothetical protein